MHQAIVELQDANRDVLVGKRTTNCLSCGKGGAGGEAQIMGKDGRVYKGLTSEHIRNSNLGAYLESDANATQAYLGYDGLSPLGGPGGIGQATGLLNNQNPLNTNMSEATI